MPYNGVLPFFAGDAVAMDGVCVVGDAHLGDRVNLWFNAVLRADTLMAMHIGDRVNIQDHAMFHATQGKSALTVGDDVTIGHRALLHGCTIEPLVLVGMGAIVMDHAVIGEGCLIAAGSVVTEGKVFAPYTLIAGVPAVAKKALDPETVREAHRRSAEKYWEKALSYGGKGRLVAGSLPAR